MSVMVKKNVSKTTIKLEATDIGEYTHYMELSEDTASNLLAGLQQALWQDKPQPSLLHWPMEVQSELTKSYNRAIDCLTGTGVQDDQPIAQSPKLVWVYNESRGGNWCCGGGVYTDDRWACHNILVKYAPHVTTNMTIRLEMYDKLGPGRAAVTIHSGGLGNYPMELDNQRTDSYSALRDCITAHKGHNRVYLGVQVVADTAPCQERGPKTL